MQIQKRRKKADQACVYCRRSHMTCDNARPCTRCVRRNIPHLCRDEPVQERGAQGPGVQAAPLSGVQGVQGGPVHTPMPPESAPLPLNENIGSEFQSITEFLNGQWDLGLVSTHSSSVSLSDMNPTEKFMVVAADPEEASAEGRLKQVIDAKVSAGLLRPFNYVAGYDKFSQYMDSYMNTTSKQRVLAAIAKFRPSFRHTTKTLGDVDLTQVEEFFERMLLDYDRIFSSVAIPACLWRRTGEIYRGNKEFAELINSSVEDLRDGRLAIYQVMSEESTVNYWDKYSSIAFNSGQKAVVSSCTLRTLQGRKRQQCCFSFTIIRDKYNIPVVIVGNFIPIM